MFGRAFRGCGVGPAGAADVCGAICGGVFASAGGRFVGQVEGSGEEGGHLGAGDCFVGAVAQWFALAALGYAGSG